NAGAARRPRPPRRQPGHTLLAFPRRRPPSPSRLLQDVSMPGEKPDGLLAALHPLDVVVARVREVRVAATADLLDHPTNGLLQADPRGESQDPLDPLWGDPVAPHQAIRVIDIEIDLDAHLPQGP